MQNQALAQFLLEPIRTAASLGYSIESSGTADDTITKWTKPCGWSSVFRQFVQVDVVAKHSDEIDLVCEFGVESPLLNEMEAECRLWECDLHIPRFDSGENGEPLYLYSIAFQWIAHDEPQWPSGWTVHAGADNQSVGEQFGLAFESVIDAHFLRFKSINDTLKLLFEVDVIHSTSDAPGVALLDPLCYGAIAMLAAGRFDQAQSLLADATTNSDFPDMVKRLIRADPGYQRVLDCRAQKLLRHLRSLG